jgi:NAD(P)-dependent dehydrogenase (short-subunit alcohol dehydrogenase family)
MTPVSNVPVAGVLAGRVCVVTGAAAGIGRAVARLFARAGATLVLADRDAERLAQVGQEVAAAECVVADVTHADAPARILAPALARGGPDVVVNNAGITTVRPLLDTTDEDWDAAIAVCVTSAFRLSREAVRAMVARGRGGAIVNMASVNGMMGQPCVSAYAAAKGGVHALTRQLAVECGRHGIRVNALSPGLIVTDANAPNLWPEDLRLTIEAYPIGRVGKPEDVAHAALFLASDAAAFITGHDLVVDGGLTAQMGASVVSPRIRGWSGLPPLVFKDDA